ncbi:MAG: flavin monoamine oxidase family protein [Beijerinckiaceae bacterium]
MAEASYDVAVIGAGAAGIAAGRALRSAGVDVLLLEARSRPGGRGWTRIVDGRALDMGCGWLHSADVSRLPALAREAGFTVDESLPPWQREPDRRVVAPEVHAAFRSAMNTFEQRLFAAGEREEDCPASELLEAGCAFNPLLDAVCTFVNGVELNRLSVHDVTRYRDSEVNHRVTEGMGTLLAELAKDLPVVYDCAVSSVDRRGALLRLATDKGEVSARSAIVTVPTNTLASGALRFTPELQEHLDAASHLPLGADNKIFLSVEGAGELPQSSFVFGRRDRTQTGSYHLTPFGWPLIEGYFGGAFARQLEREGEIAFTEQAISELCGVFGNAWRSRLKPVAASAWCGDPYALGSYSHALPGHADKRAVLAAPIEDRIFFAGEATSPEYFSTAHGAYESGLRAAKEALSAVAWKL